MAKPPLELQTLVTAARTLGSGRTALYLPDAELLSLIGLILADLGKNALAQQLGDGGAVGGSYFQRPLASFEVSPFGARDFWEVLLRCQQEVEDFATYFRCLCEIHKRRRKYDVILSKQAFPTSDQIAPRALLEFGLSDSSALATWLTWRKWLFDLDNRAGQETGYLFEPILSAALGGVPFSPRRSPIKRAERPTDGRQVDCIVGCDAYEFKIRVTIAASGQGRWSEELAFPVDCRASGFNPILVVLDPTPNPRLTDLSAAFVAAGGSVYIGQDAWAHLEQRAGPTMAVFLETYVRRPVANISDLMQAPANMTLRSVPGGDVCLTFDLPAGAYERRIVRAASVLIQEDPDEDDLEP
ncbi:hypothetical protein [Bosea beijingensis]|uniref:hypothetical protein n=1 Tax=Bosea beijingensis TaxID=3068632 RepID=UPI002741FE9A|nr:hypothetical protein [Bosea sp. REN20]